MKTFVDDSSFWDAIYKLNAPNWDLKNPTPAFVDMLNDKKIIDTGKILILGSGYGYDAVAAAKAGLEVTAIDFSQTAVNTAKKIAAKEGVKVNFIVDDFFNLPEYNKDYYDYVYDYVTLCAINPGRREEYAEMIASILKCRGRLIALLFPVENRQGGPPFGLNVKEVTDVFGKHLKLRLTTKQIKSIKPRRGREVLQIYEKEC